MIQPQTAFDFAAKYSPQNRVSIWGVMTVREGVDNLAQQMENKPFSACLRRADIRLLSEVILVSNRPEPFNGWYELPGIRIGALIVEFGAVARYMDKFDYYRGIHDDYLHHKELLVRRQRIRWAAKSCVHLSHLREECLHGIGMVIRIGNGQDKHQPVIRHGTFFESEADAVHAHMLVDKWKGDLLG